MHCSREFFDVLMGELLVMPDEGKRKAASTCRSVSDVFAGETQETLRCAQCSACRSNTSILFRIMQVPGYDGDQSEISLETLFDNFVASSEYLPGFVCQDCSSIGTTTCTTSFIAAPKNLVIHLTRMSESNVKQFRPVLYPLKFELPSSASAILASYELVGVARHLSVTGRGTQMGGHYVANVRESDGSWRVCNDEVVEHLRAGSSPTNPGSIEDTPYLLFYERTGVEEDEEEEESTAAAEMEDEDNDNRTEYAHAEVPPAVTATAAATMDENDDDDVGGDRGDNAAYARLLTPLTPDATAQVLAAWDHEEFDETVRIAITACCA